MVKTYALGEVSPFLAEETQHGKGEYQSTVAYPEHPSFTSKCHLTSPVMPQAKKLKHGREAPVSRHREGQQQGWAAAEF